MIHDARGSSGSEWEWSEEELEAWINHKRDRAIRFVQQGYSVEWSQNNDHFMTVYLPECHQEQLPELRASIQFYGEGSQFGIDGGCISKLHIQRRRTDIVKEVVTGRGTKSETLFNYDRGHDINRLAEDARARALYDAVIRELN